MKPIHHIKYLYRLNKELYSYVQDYSFLSRQIFLQFLDGLKLITNKAEGWRFKLVEILNKSYFFKTPFGTFICHTENAWSVMQENYEPEIKQIIVNNSKKNINIKNKYFINIGTHIGRWAIDIVRNHGYEALCFEPSPETFKILKVNTILSQVDDKISLYNFGLGNRDGVVEFEYFASHDGSSRVLQETDKYSTHANIIKVPIKKFDDLGISNKIIENTKLIIIDVEGFELSVLQGMETTLKKFNDIDIVIEIFEGHKSKQNTIDFMGKLGYNSKQIEKDNWLFSK